METGQSGSRKLILILVCLVVCVFIIYKVYTPIKQHFYWKSVESRIQIAKNYVAEKKSEAALAEYKSLLSELIDKNDVSYMSSIFFEMGNAQLNIAQDSKKEIDYEEAIKYFSGSLIGFTKKGYPDKYAAACCNLGIAYRDLWGINKKPSYIKKAFESFTEAIDGFTSVNNNRRCAEVLVDLGITYAELAKAENTEENLQLSINAYQEAREYWKKDKANLFLVGIILNNEAAVFKKMAGIKERKKNLAIAFNLYTEALTIFAGDSYPEYKKLAANGLEETRKLMAYSK